MKFDFRRPRRTQLLFFGNTGLSILRNYIDEGDYVVYENPRQRINFWVALFAIPLGRKSELTYYKAFLKLFRPKCAITMEDNSLTFYATKLFRPECKTLAVQNGIRGTLSNHECSSFSADLQSKTAIGYGADVIATLGKSGTNFFKAIVKESATRIVEVGSLRNNALPHAMKVATPRLVMVSTFPNVGEDKDWDRESWKHEIAGYMGPQSITFESLYRIESVLAAVCAQVAAEVNYAFVILGKRPSSQPAEFQFFSDTLIDYQWTYQPASDQASSYVFANTDDVIVSTDSTLGFELLSRGLKVALITARMQVAGLHEVDGVTLSSLVGLPRRGAFWTDDSSQSEIRRVIQFVVGTPKSDWDVETSSIRNSVVDFDPGNQRFCTVLNTLGIKNSGPGYWRESLIPTN